MFQHPVSSEQWCGCQRNKSPCHWLMDTATSQIWQDCRKSLRVETTTDNSELAQCNVLFSRLSRCCAFVTVDGARQTGSACVFTQQPPSLISAVGVSHKELEPASSDSSRLHGLPHLWPGDRSSGALHAQTWQVRTSTRWYKSKRPHRPLNTSFLFHSSWEELWPIQYV